MARSNHHMIVLVGDEFDVWAEDAFQRIQNDWMVRRFEIDGVSIENLRDSSNVARCDRFVPVFPDDRRLPYLDLPIRGYIQPVDEIVWQAFGNLVKPVVGEVPDILVCH